MNVSVGKRWESWIEALLVDGRYGSASEVVREGLRLVEEREHKLAALRETRWCGSTTRRSSAPATCTTS